MLSQFEQQKKYFQTDVTKAYDFRIKQLLLLKSLIESYELDIMKALHTDLNKSSFEAYTTEIGFCLHSIHRSIKKLKQWMKPKKVKTPFYQLHTKSYIMPEPKGTVLIIGPYNYPFQLIIEPLIGAISAGNTIILKPSEYAKSTESLLTKMINENFDAAYIHVITGDQNITSELIHLPFDHIFFTGSTLVGKIVYEAASQNLVPVTLELGGKSPTIIDETANLRVAARRIAFGKFINAGQTCIAPDYLYVHEKIHDQFLKELHEVIETMYDNHHHLGRIINMKHFNRLFHMVNKDNVINSYRVDETEKLISPIVMKDVTWNDPIMQQEIFGPILPVLTYKDIHELIELLKTKEKPLALYLFSNNKQTMKDVWSKLSFGGGAINDTLMHVSNPYLPFGGIGASGIGSYHGYYSFELFSHMKGYILRKTFFDPSFAYPPYSKKKEKLIRFLLK